jgi:hypothetical protein
VEDCTLGERISEIDHGTTMWTLNTENTMAAPASISTNPQRNAKQRIAAQHTASSKPSEAVLNR